MELTAAFNLRELKRVGTARAQSRQVIIARYKTTTLGPAYNEQKDAKETARYKSVLVVTELFNTVVNDFDAKQSARYSRVLVVTELVLSWIQYNCWFHKQMTDYDGFHLKIF